MFISYVSDKKELTQRIHRKLHDQLGYVFGKPKNGDEYVWDTETKQKLRKYKRFWATLDNDDEVIFKIDLIGNGLDYLKLDCDFEDNGSGSHLTYYSITTSFCKSKYESGRCVNGRIPITELIQDLEDALARKKEAWGD